MLGIVVVVVVRVVVAFCPIYSYAFDHPRLNLHQYLQHRLLVIE